MHLCEVLVWYKGNTSICIQIGGKAADACLQRNTVWGTDEVSDTVLHANPSTDTSRVACETCLSECCPANTAQRAVVAFSCTTCTSATGLWSSPPVLSMASTQNCWWTCHFLPCVGDWWGNIHKEHSKQSRTLHDSLATWRSSFQQTFSVTDWPGITELPDWTGRDSESSRWNPVRWFPWKNTLPFIGSHVVSARQRPSPLYTTSE
jgi:hypothetical protein